MNEWQVKLKETIESIPFAPYARGNGDGVTEDIYWNGQRIYRAGSPRTSMCVGAVAEALFKTLKKFDGESKLTTSQVKALRPWIYVYDEEKRGGVAEGLVRLGIADWIRDPREAQFGDFAQINGTRFNNGTGGMPYWDDGHSVIVTGVSQHKGIEAIDNWSSNNIGSNPGHMNDWHAIEKSRNGVSRRWYIARLKPSFLGISGQDYEETGSGMMWTLGILGAAGLTLAFLRWRRKKNESSSSR